jgi:hypothetical protein
MARGTTAMVDRAVFMVGRWIMQSAYFAFIANNDYEFFWSFVSANLLQIFKIDLSFDPNFITGYLSKYWSNPFD